MCVILVRPLYQGHISGARTDAFFYSELFSSMAKMEFLGKYCSDLVHFFVFIPALMKIPKYIGKHLFSKVKFRKPDKWQVDL